jgi:SAM-dependent methyltransferase
VFLDDQEPDDTVEARYEEVEDPAYVAGHQGRVATFRSQLDTVTKRLGRRGRILEIGAYTGVFLSLAQDQGWEVEGLEPSRWAVQQAEATYGLRVRQGMLSADAFPASWFDAVVMWDVIEHLTDPTIASRTAFHFLKPGGLLALSTMDIASVAARISGDRWPWLMSMHRVYFSRSTMRRMLEEAGFVDIRFVTHVRRIALSYLAERMATRLPAMGSALGAVARALSWSDVVVPFAIGDLFEVYARKPADI